MGKLRNFHHLPSRRSVLETINLCAASRLFFISCTLFLVWIPLLVLQIMTGS